MQWFRYITVTAILVVWLTGCNLSGANVNPNASADAPVSAVLSGAEVTLAFSLGVDAGLLSGTVMQQVSGANGDATANDNYTAGPGRFNSVWNNFYVDVLTNLRIVQQKAAAQQLPYYSGIARIQQSFAYGTLTDLFGDIPYSQSLQGRAVNTPAYDRQEDIYRNLQLQLDTAIQELLRPAEDNKGALPGGDDLIFSGNVRKWIAAAWTLKARYAIHLSRQQPKQAAAQVLQFLYNNGQYRGIAGSQHDALLKFGAAATNANPYYQQNANRPGWIGLGASFVNLLNGNSVQDSANKPAANLADPRRAYFATPFPTSSKQYRGGTAGVPGAYSLIGSYYGSPTSPVVLTSYAEAKFLEAEARILLNPQDPLAQTALEQAVKASFEQVIGNPDDPDATPAKQAAYIAAKATLHGNAGTDLPIIITQKYIALFLQPEVWTDYRRTGYPDIPPAQNATHGLNPNGAIPRRFPYPQSEQSLNDHVPTSSNYQQPRLWWDQ